MDYGDRSALPSPPSAGEIPLDLVDEFQVQLEEAAQEAGHEQQVLLAVRERPLRGARLFEARVDVGDVVAQGGHALAGDLLADEVADQQPEQRVALQRREGDGRARVFAERLESLVGERVDGALARLAGLLAGSR